MSNVLIGIIGVILFIGLALAGALFLGNRFSDASTSSKAAAVTSHLQQFAQAAQMMRVQNGSSVDGSIGAELGTYLVTSRDLKAVPVNPVFAYPYVGADERGGSSTDELRTVYTSLGTGPVARDVCMRIETQAGNANPASVIDADTNFANRASSARRLGCMREQGTGGRYTAYIFV